MSEKPEVSLRATASIRALLARLGPLPADYDKVHFDSALPGMDCGRAAVACIR